MKKICYLALGLALLWQSGCRSRDEEFEVELDDGAIVPFLPETENVSPMDGLASEPGGAGYQWQSGISNPELGRNLEQVPRGENDRLEDSASEVLARAKDHYRRGDFDIAVDELRKIDKSSRYYPAAQLLLKQLR